MNSTVKLHYVNRSLNLDKPKIFVFAKNELPTFDALKDGIAWKVIDKVGRESACTFSFPIETMVRASWDNGTCNTKSLSVCTGQRYIVTEDDTGIVLLADGSATDTRSIDVVSDIHTHDGISVDLYKDGRILMSKRIVAYGQKATFELHPKLYWGVASEIQEGEDLSSAVLNSDSFFEQNLEGITEATIGLYGNAQDGYMFKVESQS
ncbi:hypothetical protein RWV98_18700 [Agathobaculum sp. NTUH-O15-33]|uniref:hypothetical protein n=1 Tax=Agathobaculum sp. NTUH-O15-33 TaxID=3079302 RepID=UPI0029583E9F|nr:hypothetical protein [Agathobaculum sp. NTUH-O15-33]WNX84579.1 hypothetical protein RWV98_18700 [Agathobaculum sp. NTUH-O15-33]